MMIAVNGGIHLLVSEPEKETGIYPSSCIQKGLLLDPHNNIAFTLSRVRGSMMFFGRELLADRLAWSGLAYSFSPSKLDFAYDKRIGAGK